MLINTMTKRCFELDDTSQSFEEVKGPIFQLKSTSPLPQQMRIPNCTLFCTRDFRGQV